MAVHPASCAAAAPPLAPTANGGLRRGDPSAIPRLVSLLALLCTCCHCYAAGDELARLIEAVKPSIVGIGNLHYVIPSNFIRDMLEKK